MGLGVIGIGVGPGEIAFAQDVPNAIVRDERILGDSSFVMAILADAEQKLERRLAMKQAGIDIETVEKRVARLFSLVPDEIYRQGRDRRMSQARSVFCFWAARELGLPQKELANRLCVSEPAITYAIRRGEEIVRQKGYRLSEE